MHLDVKKIGVQLVFVSLEKAMADIRKRTKVSMGRGVLYVATGKMRNAYDACDRNNVKYLFVYSDFLLSIFFCILIIC